MSADVFVELEGIEGQLNRLSHIKGGTNKAIRRAAKRAATTGKKEMSKDIRIAVTVPAKAVNKVLTVNKSGETGYEVALDKTNRIPLRDFGARQTKKGVSYRISKGGKRGFVPGAFIVKSLGGHVFKRGTRKAALTPQSPRWNQSNASKGKRTDNLPIIKLKGVSVAGVFAVYKLRPEYKRVFKKKFRRRLEHEINFLIKQAEEKAKTKTDG